MTARDRIHASDHSLDRCLDRFEVAGRKRQRAFIRQALSEGVWLNGEQALAAGLTRQPPEKANWYCVSMTAVLVVSPDRCVLTCWRTPKAWSRPQTWRRLVGVRGCP